MGVYIKGDISGEQVTMTNTSGGGGWTTLFTASTTGYYRVTGEGYNRTTQGNCSLTVSGGTIVSGTNYVYLENYQTKQIDCVLYVTAGGNVEMYCERYSYSNGGGRNFSALSYGTISPECNELLNAYIGIPSPESITLDKSSISLTTVGQTEQLTATIEPELSDHSVTWTSSDTTVATVSSSGLVTCVTPGTATIIATTVNGLTATCGVGGGGWQPGANTIAYYPLTANFNDESGNNRNLSGGGSITTIGGVSCAYLSQTARAENASVPFGTTRTISVWLNSDMTNTEDGVVVWTGGDGRANTKVANISLGGGSNISGGNFYNVGQNSGVNVTKGVRYYAVMVCSGGSIYIYVNGELKANTSMTLSSGNGIYLGRRGDSITSNGRYQGYISRVIVEDKARTATEIADYYNLTKADYGL